MTPHERINHHDGSVSVRAYAGGRWTVRHGPTNGQGDIFDCTASRFVEAQNRHIRDFHQPSVRGYLGKGEAAE